MGEMYPIISRCNSFMLTSSRYCFANSPINLLSEKVDRAFEMWTEISSEHPFLIEVLILISSTLILRTADRAE